MHDGALCASRRGLQLRRRQKGLREEVIHIAWKAQTRLCGRYRRLVSKGKKEHVATTAVARELLGFIWAIGIDVERRQALEHKVA